ncbi:MAG: phosphatidylglycerophosphatase A [Bacteroidia bacterium]
MKFFYRLIASGFGSGFSPVAPGTVGSLVGCLFAYLFHLIFSGYDYSVYYLLFLVFCLLFVFIGIVTVNKLENEWGKDAPRFTIDEIAGMLFSLMFVPLEWKSVLIAFVLFRFFDILKPFGIRSLEKVHGGWGVMLDDVLAGIYANILLHVILFSFQLI